MAAYTTIENLTKAFGADRRNAALPDFEPKESEDRLNEMIRSASSYIDSYLSAGGYSVPIDFDSISNASAKENLQSLLSDICIAVVIAMLIPAGTKGIARGAKINGEWAQKWLERIADGDGSLAGLSTSQSRIKIVGSNTPVLPDSLFSLIKIG